MLFSIPTTICLGGFLLLCFKLSSNKEDYLREKEEFEEEKKRFDEERFEKENFYSSTPKEQLEEFISWTNSTLYGFYDTVNLGDSSYSSNYEYYEQIDELNIITIFHETTYYKNDMYIFHLEYGELAVTTLSSEDIHIPEYVTKLSKGDVIKRVEEYDIKL